MRGLQDKVAIVTGGAASIGLAITEALHAAGVRVVVAARTREKGEALARRLGDSVAYLHTDITSDEQLEQLVAHALQRFGRLDFVVNNACSYVDNGCSSTRVQWLATLDTNLVSGAILVEIARPHLANSGVPWST